MKIWIWLLFLIVSCCPVEAHDWQHDQFAQTNRQWLEKQTRPGTNQSCCNGADQDYVDEEFRADNHYWVASNKTEGRWLKVPPEAVIKDPNLHGRAVAWYRWEGSDGSYSTSPRPDLQIVVYCFSPGAGI